MTRHQYEISAVVGQKPFHGESRYGVAKCWLLSQAQRTPTDFIRKFFAAVTIMVFSTHFGEEVCALRGKRVLIDKTQKLGSQSRSSARKRALYSTIIVLQRSKDSFLPPTKRFPLCDIFYMQTLAGLYIAGLHLSLASFALLPSPTGYRIITCSKPILFTNST